VYEHLFKPPSKGVKLFEESSYANGESTEQNLDLCLFSVACEMNVVGGEFGFRPRTEEDNGCKDYDKEIGVVTGSVFWFCIPCMDLDDDGTSVVSKTEEDVKQSIVPGGVTSKIDQQNSEVITASEETKATRKKRALVVEDSAIIRKMLNRILVKKGFEVSEADNGMQGLEKLKSSLYDITLVDFLMPIMDGLDCMQQYREWEKYHRPWISQRMIGISAHASQEDIEKGLKIGMDDYRPKPITFKVLSDLIESDKQKEMSRRLDEIETREAVFRSGDDGNDGSNGKEAKKPKKKHIIDGRACTLLMISPRGEEEQTKLMLELIKESGWQTTTASSEREALVWLKMRNWDLVLVDDTLASMIGDFRKWESKKRQTQQERVTLMAGNANDLEDDGIQSIQGLDAIVRKPVGLNAVEKLLENTYLHLSKSDTK
jgi:CheY-like chemotaxis protein